MPIFENTMDFVRGHLEQALDARGKLQKVMGRGIFYASWQGYFGPGTPKSRQSVDRLDSENIFGYFATPIRKQIEILLIKKSVI